MLGDHTHSTRDLALTDRREGEALPLVFHLSQRLRMAVGWSFDREVLLDRNTDVADSEGVLEGSRRRRHVEQLRQGCLKPADC